MNIFDAYSDITGASGSGTYDRLGYDGRERRLAEERETDRYRAWAGACHPASVELPYRIWCFGCGRSVDIVNVHGRDWFFEPTTTNLHRCTYRRPRR